MVGLARWLVMIAVALAAAGAASAQEVTALMHRSAGGIDYVNGGVGDGVRDAMSKMPGFDLKLVFSNLVGEYLVADHVAVQGPTGEVFAVDEAGPWLLLRLPAGSYTVSAQYAGATQQRTVRVGPGMQTLNWRFAAN